MYKLLIAIPIVAAIMLLALLCFFSAFRYMDGKDDKPEKYLFIALGILSVLMGTFVGIGIMNC